MASRLGERKGEPRVFEELVLAPDVRVGVTSRMTQRGVRQDIHMKLIRYNNEEAIRWKLGMKLRKLFRQERMSHKWYGKLINKIGRCLHKEEDLYCNSTPIDDYIDE